MAQHCFSLSAQFLSTIVVHGMHEGYQKKLLPVPSVLSYCTPKIGKALLSGDVIRQFSWRGEGGREYGIEEDCPQGHTLKTAGRLYK